RRGISLGRLFPVQHRLFLLDRELPDHSLPHALLHGLLLHGGDVPAADAAAPAVGHAPCVRPSAGARRFARHVESLARPWAATKQTLSVTSVLPRLQR